MISSEHRHKDKKLNLLELHIPHTNLCVRPGDVVKLGRFDTVEWEVNHGWFSFGGNRAWCGWYLKSVVDGEYVEKPVQLTDLDDVYVVKKQGKRGC